MATATLLTATVSGFVLVIDPNNEKGRKERIEFSDATLMSARLTELRRGDTAFYKANPHLNYNPTEENFYTLYCRDDNGDIEAQNGFDPSGKTKVGTPAYKATCGCGDISWIQFYGAEGEPASAYRCSECTEMQFRSEFQCGDSNNYDGSMEREY